jgi:[ribosomal protein S5]-alanine N-acetyltransferase
MDNPNAPAILITKRLLFRRHVIADMEAFCAMEQDAEVRKFVGGYPRQRDDAERRFMNTLQPHLNDRLAMWATILKDENKYIGRCGVYQHFNNKNEPVKDEGALAYYIARKYWGNGYATEAGKAFVDFGFDELKLKRIVTSIQAGNEASVSVIKKLGFTLDYTEPATENNPRSFLHFEIKNPNVLTSK